MGDKVFGFKTRSPLASPPRRSKRLSRNQNTHRRCNPARQNRILLEPLECSDNSSRYRGSELAEPNERDKDQTSSMIAPPKYYRQLETLPNLAQTHVQELVSGAFVKRSATRWQEYQSQRSVLNRGRNRYAMEAWNTVWSTSAVVIQARWRCYRAKCLKEALVAECWNEQIQSIKAFCTLYIIPKDNILLTEVNSFSQVMSIIPDRQLMGVYYQFPATLIAIYWRHYIHSRRVRHFRRSSVVTRLIDYPIQNVLHESSTVWRIVINLAVECLSRNLRCYLANCRFYYQFAYIHRMRAANRIKRFFRYVLANAIVSRLRQYRAAVVLQCFWRSYLAKHLVHTLRFCRFIRTVWSGYVTKAIRTVVEYTCHTAACRIQAKYRSVLARSLWRSLWCAREQARWRSNPSKGWRLFHAKQYHLAAVYFESFRQRGGIPESLDELTERKADMCERVGTPLTDIPSRIGRLSVNYASTSSIMQFLAFWQAYLSSHFARYEATGDVYSLDKAREGISFYLLHEKRLRSSVSLLSDESEKEAVWFLYWQTRLRGAQCLLWRGMQESYGQGVREAQQIYLALEQDQFQFTNKDHVHAKRQWVTHLLIILAEDAVLSKDYKKSCRYLEELVSKKFEAYAEEDLYVLLALLYMRLDGESSDKGSMYLKQAYQRFELYSSVGYYHGKMCAEEADNFLASQLSGSFLVHHLDSELVLCLRVKLDTGVHSMRIDVNKSQNLWTYSSPKQPGVIHVSLHGFIEQLPEWSGVDMEKGMRKSLHHHCLHKKLVRKQDKDYGGHLARLRKLLPWEQWQDRLLNASLTVCTRNEAWSVACFEVAKSLEIQQAWHFALLLLEEATACSNDKRLRPRILFSKARAHFHLQHQSESIKCFQRARLETSMFTDLSVQTAFLGRNFTAVERGLLVAMGKTHSEIFQNEVRRMQKLERMCIRAWQFDSLSVGMQGDPFLESLLLQRVDAELYYKCADTFFLRSLLRAHTRAFLLNEYNLDQEHVRRALSAGKHLLRLEMASGTANEFSMKRWFLDPVICTKFLNEDSRGSCLYGSSLIDQDIWNRIPCTVGLELAEILYRASISLLQAEGLDRASLIACYHKLHARWTKAMPTLKAEGERMLLRLAFLSLEYGSTDQSYFDWSLYYINLLIINRENGHAGRNDITWPVNARLPSSLSLPELYFIRGFIRETSLYYTNEVPNANLTLLWSDYDRLYQQLHKYVLDDEIAAKREKDRHAAHKEDNLETIRIYIGATKNVVLKEVLRSRPYLIVACGRKSYSIHTPPDWSTLEPKWDEYVEVHVRDPDDTIVISLYNRLNSQSMSQAQCVGSVKLSIRELMSMENSEGQFFPFVHQQRLSTLGQIFLQFQLLLKKDIPRRSRKLRRRGHWDLDELRNYLPGDVELFASSRWVWSKLGHIFKRDKEFAIAAWFYIKAVDCCSTTLLKSSTLIQLGAAKDTLSLLWCADAGSCQAIQVDTSYLVRQAESLLERIPQISYDTELECAKLSADVEYWQTKLNGEDTVSPCTQEIRKRRPASSTWVKVSGNTLEGTISEMYVDYLNIDTGETFCSLAGEEPLEYEPNEHDAAENTSYTQRSVCMSVEMQERVRVCLDQIIDEDLNDTNHCYVLKNREGRLLHYYHSHLIGSISSFTINEWTMYCIIRMQDTYRRYYCRKRKRRAFKGVLWCVVKVLSLYSSSRAHLYAQREAARKKKLSLLTITIEDAQSLRIADALTSDPFVLVSLIDPQGQVVVQGETSVCHNTVNPKWEEEFEFDYEYTRHERLRLACHSGRKRRQKRDVEKNSFASTLVFEVYDCDYISSAKTTEEEQDSSDGSREFLGMATVSIDQFENGALWTFELPLKDEDNETSPRSRGILRVGIQWTARRRDLSLLTVSSIIKSSQPRRPQRPPVPEQICTKLNLLGKKANTISRELLLLGTTVLPQVAQLARKWALANQTAKTAEEAKVLEIRLNGYVEADLAPRQASMSDQMLAWKSQAKEFQEEIRHLATLHISNHREELRAQMQNELGDKMKALEEILSIHVDDFAVESQEEIASSMTILQFFFEYQEILRRWTSMMQETVELFTANSEVTLRLEKEERLKTVYAELRSSFTLSSQESIKLWNV